nr:transcriptional regulator SlmA, TetR family [uncultured bacterium]
MKPGERKLQILQTLAGMLEVPRAEKITTAALAARLDVSEAALYRHFASKAQMFEGLIEFIESTLFGLINKISAEQGDGLVQAAQIVAMLLNFAEKNPGMTRVLTGDALVNEDERLQVRINQLHDRIEASLKQSLRLAHAADTGSGSAPGAAGAGDADAAAHANLLLCYVVGRWQLFAKSRFKRLPSEQWDVQRRVLLG